MAGRHLFSDTTQSESTTPRQLGFNYTGHGPKRQQLPMSHSKTRVAREIAARISGRAFQVPRHVTRGFLAAPDSSLRTVRPWARTHLTIWDRTPRIRRSRCPQSSLTRPPPLRNGPIAVPLPKPRVDNSPLCLINQTNPSKELDQKLSPKNLLR